MFSVLKKLATKQDGPQTISDNAGCLMSGTLQKKFSRGVQYNMKIIIKGDRNVGKSCLLKRLQGGNFVETYIPTEEIQVASIQWSFKATEDIVKVEVWDVVDRGKARQRHNGLKLSTGALPDTPALDAEFLDVYKGTHGVILMMDITKAWTFEYVAKELSKIPPYIPVLILGNHCDMSHHRVITTGQAMALSESYASRPGEVLYAESSMRNGFGLRLLHKFLGLPFLRLQKESLLSLIERNKRDTEICNLEISEFMHSNEADYNYFLDNLSLKRRKMADSHSKLPYTLPQNQLSNLSLPKNLTPEQLKPTKSIIIGGGQPIIVEGRKNFINKPYDNASINSLSTPNIVMPKIKEYASEENNIGETIIEKSEINNTQILVKKNDKNLNAISVEEFCPDDGTLDKSFLEDFSGNIDENQTKMENIDSDSDSEVGNPLVAKFNDDSEELELNVILSKSTLEDKTEHRLRINPLSKSSKNFSIENENNLCSEKIFDNFRSNNDDNLADWLADSSLRRSPEGGEDISSIPSINIDADTYRHKKKKNKKKSEGKDKKKKRHSKEVVLEEFLNGSSKNSNHDDKAYEAF